MCQTNRTTMKIETRAIALSDIFRILAREERSTNGGKKDGVRGGVETRDQSIRSFRIN